MFANNKSKKYVKYLFISLLTILLLGIIIYHIHTIYYPYQIEYREGAEINRTKLLSEGCNLYDYNSLPASHSQYGFMYNYLVYSCAKYLNLNINLSLHRSVTAIFILLSATLIFIYIFKNSGSFLKSYIGFILLYVSLLNPFIVLGLPGAMGMFFFLGSIFIPYYKKYSKFSLIISILFGMIAFYTKIYFLFGLIYLTLYLFSFVSKKKGLLYGITSVAILFITLIVTEYLAPTYFENTIIIAYKGASYSLLHLIHQIKHFIILYLGLFFILTSVFFLKKKYKKFIHLKIKNVNLNFSSFRAPLFNFKLNLNIFCLISSIVVIMKFGGHTGTFMQYFIQLISPFFVIFVLEKIKYKSSIYHAYILICILNIFTIFYLYTYEVDLNSYKNNFAKIENDLKKYNKVFNSPAICSILIKNNMPVYDTGQVEYLKNSNGKVVEIYNKYLDNIDKMIRNKKFDAIYVTKGEIGQTLINKGSLLENYCYIKSFILNMPNQKWNIQKWLPNSE